MNNGEFVDNFEIKLLNGLTFDLYNSLKRGPVVINFIMGTWCPFCTNHLKKIRTWQETINRNVTMLIISSEPPENLRHWLNKNPMTYLFASDENAEIINSFGVKHLLIDIASPATFLIDVDTQIKMAFKGIRTRKTRAQMLETICTTADCGDTEVTLERIL
ncbi:redoxin [Bacteriovorax sp. BSW11_IV]|uniref:peroxiredoxin family protein n=1 Tax=Bacteriovorax sp. BSW11_IV TaxID=1353529 RepID=UPI00038A2C53|nr:redoxin domain-containing protein [Bacteriovorax sp. BSW11_IV]EQC50222.1 redoxin [Bacteriovorax sp. BSW11_IV]